MHPNHTEQTLTQEEKMNIEIIKEIISEKKDYITITKKLRLKNSQGKNKKINELLTHFLMNSITELDELICARAKLVCDKSGVLLKNTNRNSKPGW